MTALRSLLKLASWFITGFSRSSTAGADVVVLMYHRVTGDVPLELDLPFAVFRAQMIRLAERRVVVSVDEAVRRLEKSEKFDRTLFVITFDDAYRDFYTHAFPLLCDLDLPVTLYVPTGFLDCPGIPPTSHKLANEENLQPVTWAMLEEMFVSPLLTIGSHTHSHAELPSLPDEEILEELDRCDTLLQHRLGQPMRHFAYPRGAWDERVEQLVKGRYETAALAGGGIISANAFSPYRITRVPVLRSDGLRWFNARINGRLIHEVRLVKLAKNYIGKLSFPVRSDNDK